MFSYFLFAALSVAFYPSRGIAQHTDIDTCIPSYQWTVNSQGYTPCKVASYLEVPCSSQGYTIGALSPNTSYDNSQIAGETACDCNTVVWTLFSACARCQGGEYYNWDHWSSNCTQTFINSYPETIVGVNVPLWAWLPVELEQGGNWNETAARIGASSGHESMASSFPSSTTNASPNTLNTGMDMMAENQSSSHKKISVGMIIGAVLGGMVFLGIIAVSITFFLTRRHSYKVIPFDASRASYIPSPIGSSFYPERDPASVPLTHPYSAQTDQNPNIQPSRFVGGNQYNTQNNGLNYRGIPEF